MADKNQLEGFFFTSVGGLYSYLKFDNYSCFHIDTLGSQAAQAILDL